MWDYSSIASPAPIRRIVRCASCLNQASISYWTIVENSIPKHDGISRSGCVIEFANWREVTPNPSKDFGSR
jgi:hypothetical protein